ncbi:MAG: 4-vinyl reductase [Chloroflexota bacterium]
MQGRSELYYPNRIARAIFMAMDDVMGAHGLQSLLSLARMEQYADSLPPDDMSRAVDFSSIAALNIALEELYGANGGRGMALRIGQRAFVGGLKNFGAMRAANDAAFRNLPVHKRTEYGLQGLALILTNFSDQKSSVVVKEDSLEFISEVSPYAWGRNTNKPVCHMMVGIIMECLRWSTNGYKFYVREIECTATGAERCVFRINKQAIGEQ